MSRAPCAYLALTLIAVGLLLGCGVAPAPTANPDVPPPTAAVVPPTSTVAGSGAASPTPPATAGVLPTVASTVALTPAPGATPTAIAAGVVPTAVPSTLHFLWPTMLPRQLAVRPDRSSANEAAFLVVATEPDEGQFHAIITGGAGSRAGALPPEVGRRAVTVRGQAGIAFSTGAGFSLFWQEEGQPYAVLSSLGLTEALALANGLQPLDLPTWRARVAALLPPETTAHERVFSVGRGPDGITYSGEGIDEMQRTGPGALAVAPDGSYWLADSGARRLLHRGPTGAPLGTIALDDAPRVLEDLAVSATDIYVLDVSPTPVEVLRLGPDGARRARFSLPAGYQPSDGLTGIALDEAGRLLVEKDFGRVVARLLGPDGTVAPMEVPGHGRQGRTVTLHPPNPNQPDSDRTRGAIQIGTVRVEVAVGHQLGGLSFVGFAPDGSFFARVEEVADTGQILVDQTVRHHAADGRLLGQSRFPLARQYTYVGNALAVGPDGVVHALITRPEGVEIQRLRFSPTLAPVLPPAESSTARLATYTHPRGAWSVRYPADLLRVETIGPDLVIFISQDRATVAAVDLYTAAGNAYGNTGEDLRNRARETLARIYGAPVSEALPLDRAPAPWETGVSFTTALGSEGEAVYQQRGRGRGDFRVVGFLLGHKSARAAEMAPLLRAMRESFALLDG